MQVKVSFTFTPEPDEVDDKDSTGLTVEAFEKIHATLASLGAENVDIRKAPRPIRVINAIL